MALKPPKPSGPWPISYPRIDLSTLVLLPGDNTPVVVWVVESGGTLTAAVLELDRATGVSRWSFVIGTLNVSTGQGSGDVFDDGFDIDDTVNYTFTSTGFSFTTATGNLGTATRLFPQRPPSDLAQWSGRVLELVVRFGTFLNANPPAGRAHIPGAPKMPPVATGPARLLRATITRQLLREGWGLDPRDLSLVKFPRCSEKS